MTNTKTTELLARATSALYPTPAVGVCPVARPYATITVTLPDGTEGTATASHVIAAIRQGGHVSVQQGKRVDVMHASQLA